MAYRSGRRGGVSRYAIKAAARQAANSAVRRVKGGTRGKKSMQTKLMWGAAAAAALYFTKDKWMPLIKK